MQKYTASSTRSANWDTCVQVHPAYTPTPCLPANRHRTVRVAAANATARALPMTAAASSHGPSPPCRRESESRHARNPHPSPASARIPSDASRCHRANAPSNHTPLTCGPAPHAPHHASAPPACAAGAWRASRHSATADRYPALPCTKTARPTRPDSAWPPPHGPPPQDASETPRPRTFPSRHRANHQRESRERAM